MHSPRCRGRVGKAQIRTKNDKKSHPASSASLAFPLSSPLPPLSPPLLQDITVAGRYGRAGAPWEFNLRDLCRWADLIAAATAATTAAAAAAAAAAAPPPSQQGDDDAELPAEGLFTTHTRTQKGQETGGGRVGARGATRRD